MSARLAVLVALGLAACAPRPPVATAWPGYRDRNVPIATPVLFEPARFMGTWHEVARYPVPFQQGCDGVTMTFAAAGEGFTVTSGCGGGASLAGSATLTGPGRFQVDFGDPAFVARAYWVLWVDEGYRTAVIGTPDGRAGWILNRDPAIPADRLAAARDLLDFNGYDLSRLVLTGG